MKATSGGYNILHDPLWNKGTAFKPSERERLGLRGLIPPMVKTLEEQKARVDAHLDSYSTPEEKNLYLQDLANRNETLYFRCLVDDIEKMAPLVYTPTVGSVCENFADQFRRARGKSIALTLTLTVTSTLIIHFVSPAAA